MKVFIGNALAKILDRMDFTVVIGCKVNGEITCIRNTQYFYNNDFSETQLFTENGQEFELPDGKFTLKSKYNNELNKYVEWYRKVVNKNNK